VLTKVVGARREVAGTWMYREICFVMFAGIFVPPVLQDRTPPLLAVGRRHLRSLKPLPLVFMVLDAFRTKRGARNVTNKAGLFYTVAHAIFNFGGAGLWGVIHTLPQVNKWTHGTQVTTAHGHLAFYTDAGMVQVYMERLMGLDYVTVKTM
jgi:nitric oxide reductase subunit B